MHMTSYARTQSPSNTPPATRQDAATATPSSRPATVGPTATTGAPAALPTQNHQLPESASSQRQPLSVWVLAFAAMVSFMGIGLVDPILKPIAANLGATPSQVSLLFTSYLLVTAFAMLITSFASSRLGGRTTLMLGLGIIIVFSTLAGTSDSVAALVGWRAGWGLGNALFIATALAAIIAVARGGAEKAITLYEAALGIGLSVGPLVGAVLGVLNTLFTETAMNVAPVPRPVASAGYNFVRFLGGALSPWICGKLGENVSEAAPFWFGAICVAVGLGVLVLLGRRYLTKVALAH
jgi:MFS family permease